MKFILISICTILLGTSLKAQTLKFDGYYHAFADAHNDSSWHYLRFYPDGTVIEVNSVARPGKLMANFKKDASPYLYQGTYKLTGNELQFSLADQSKQKIVYKGTLNNNILKLHSHAFSNGFEGDETFQYVKVPGLQ